MIHLSTVVPAYFFIDLIDYDRHVLKAAAEEVEALSFDFLKLLSALFGFFGAGIEG